MGEEAKKYMIPEICPFCRKPATYTLIASNDYELICPSCVIRVEITQVAAVMECPHPEIVLQYIREQHSHAESLKPLTSDDMLRGAE